MLFVTDITPSAPNFIASKPVASLPLKTIKFLPASCLILTIRLTSPVASLMPTIFSISAKRATVYGFISLPVRIGTL